MKDEFNGNLKLSGVSISRALKNTAEKHPRNTAITFMNKSFSYKVLGKKIAKLSEALCFCGVKEGDRVLVALPNIPQAVFALYALNNIGAVGVFVSPLSAGEELRNYINKCRCKLAFVLDSVFAKNADVLSELKVITTSPVDELGFLSRSVYKFSNPSVKTKAIAYKSLMSENYPKATEVDSKADDTAVVLFSGGTTGTPKAVEITNLNLNALAVGTEIACGRKVRESSMLSVLPIFHGFGLGICIHTILFFGGNTLLLPRFNKETAAKVIADYKPQYIAAVPSMLEPLMTAKALQKADLSFIDGVFSGGDSLSEILRLKFDKFLKDHGANVKVRQGYGATECVAAVCLMPDNTERPESVGLAYPDTSIKIMATEQREADVLEIGEIYISSKTLMKGYFDDKAETEKVLFADTNGKVWLRTGDAGYKDAEGFVYFKQRLKRLIITNGNNVFPSEIEKALLVHPEVSECCAVGVKDDEKISAVAVFVALKNPAESETSEAVLKAQLTEHLEKFVSKIARPKYIFFMERLPKTHLGKIAFSELQRIADDNVN